MATLASFATAASFGRMDVTILFTFAMGRRSASPILAASLPSHQPFRFPLYQPPKNPLNQGLPTAALHLLVPPDALPHHAASGLLPLCLRVYLPHTK
mmetsp:Transcript_6229/g.14359  ORF Transcript_6229/g.14359 Transcript_6229/m.14359 type:complete len:97 (-) Transcript_6229:2-292(-)